MVAGLRVTFWPRNWRGGHMAHKIQNGYGVYLLRWVSKSGVGSGEKGNLNEVGYGAVHLSTWQSMHDDVSMCRNQPRYHMFGEKNDSTAGWVQPASKLCAM